MASILEFNVDRVKKPVHATLRGAITEAAGPALTKLRAAVDGEAKVVFDCAGIATINSTGMRLWSQFLKSFPRGACSLENCSSYFIDYANLSPVLLEGARVDSFHAPYSCASCGATDDVPFQSKDIDGSGLPVLPCKQCAEPMESDINSARFLGFLQK